MKRGNLLPEDFQKFLATWIYCSKKFGQGRDNVKNPGAFLTKAIRDGTWVTHTDFVDLAEREIHKLKQDYMGDTEQEFCLSAAIDSEIEKENRNAA